MGAGSPPLGARPAAAPTPRVGVGLVAGARLPLAFICTGLCALASAAAILVLRPHLLRMPHFHPHVVALAHLWIPGFLLSVTVGAIYQLMPVVLGASLKLPLAAAWTHYGLHTAGAGMLVAGFTLGRFEIVALAGMSLAGGACILLVGTWRTFFSASRRDAVAWSLPAAATWLAATVFAGVVMALNRHAPFISLSAVDLLRAHAHLGLAGFFLTLLQGVTFQLLPMFTMSDLRRPRFICTGLWISQLGTLALTLGLACGRASVMLTGAVLLTAGIGSSGLALIATLNSRRRRSLDPGVKAFLLGTSALALAAIAGMALVALPPLRGTATGATAYGFLAIAGALSLMVLGMLCKIVPFLVWMKTYGPLAGRRKVPLASALGSRRLENSWLAIHCTAVGMLAWGILASLPMWLTVGTVLLAGAILIFLINIGRILWHLGRPEAAAEQRNHTAVALQ